MKWARRIIAPLAVMGGVSMGIDAYRGELDVFWQLVLCGVAVTAFIDQTVEAWTE